MKERTSKTIVAGLICPLFFLLQALMKSFCPLPLSINYDVHSKFCFGSRSSPSQRQQAHHRTDVLLILKSGMWRLLKGRREELVEGEMGRKSPPSQPPTLPISMQQSLRSPDNRIQE
jgi:hypothetical protein